VVRAAVLFPPPTGLIVREVELVNLQNRELRVRMLAAGVCRSDLSAIERGHWPTPIVLGHEGVGVVEEVGERVTQFKVGDRVVLGSGPQCGDCFFCRREQWSLCELGANLGNGRGVTGEIHFSLDGRDVFQKTFSGTFSEQTIVHETSLLAVPDQVSVGQAAIIGCAMMTGLGAVRRTAHVLPGACVVVIGCGGVGIHSVRAARDLGADPVVAVDVSPAKLQLASEFGAHVLANNRTGDPVEAVRRLTSGRGADTVIEAAGQSETIRLAISLCRRGGEVIMVGAPSANDPVVLSATGDVVAPMRTLRGSKVASSLREDIPPVLRAMAKGDLDFGPLISAEVALEEIYVAFERLKHGVGNRSVVRFSE
jgi:S-(hydroxymethyl)glutathione dehydrogenase / alcohol dehydrogenase